MRSPLNWLYTWHRATIQRQIAAVGFGNLNLMGINDLAVGDVLVFFYDGDLASRISAITSSPFSHAAMVNRRHNVVHAANPDQGVREDLVSDLRQGAQRAVVLRHPRMTGATQRAAANSLRTKIGQPYSIVTAVLSAGWFSIPTFSLLGYACGQLVQVVCHEVGLGITDKWGLAHPGDLVAHAARHDTAWTIVGRLV